MARMLRQAPCFNHNLTATEEKSEQLLAAYRYLGEVLDEFVEGSALDVLFLESKGGHLGGAEMGEVEGEGNDKSWRELHWAQMVSQWTSARESYDVNDILGMDFKFSRTLYMSLSDFKLFFCAL